MERRQFDALKTRVWVEDPRDGKGWMVIVDNARHIPATDRAHAEHIVSAIRFAEHNALTTLQFKLRGLLGV